MHHAIPGAILGAVSVVFTFMAPDADASSAQVAQTVSLEATTQATFTAATISTFHVVAPGDTLSALAGRYYGNAFSWSTIYNANRGKISNPNLILVGQVLTIPSTADPAQPFTATDPAPPPPRHYKEVGAAMVPHSGLGGSLSYSGLEALWESAGGSAMAAPTAACIAEHESGGNQYATGSVGEEGYWQINPVNGDATYDPLGNARAAVWLSHGGTNWEPWTTAPDCGV